MRRNTIVCLESRKRRLPCPWKTWLVYTLLGFATTSATSCWAMVPISGGNVRYRKAQKADLPGIARLLVETFEEIDNASSSKLSLPGWDRITQQFEQQKYMRQLEQRWNDLVENPNVQHVWIVAILEQSEKSDPIAGFLELGTMPLPKMDVGVSSVQQGDEVPPRERPFLANLAVSKDFRRQRIGSKLVRLAMKIAPDWVDAIGVEPNRDDEAGSDNRADETQATKPDASATILFLAVDCGNDAAIQLYDGLGFHRFLDERESLSPQIFRKLKRPPRIYFGQSHSGPK